MHKANAIGNQKIQKNNNESNVQVVDLQDEQVVQNVRSFIHANMSYNAVVSHSVQILSSTEFFTYSRHQSATPCSKCSFVQTFCESIS